MKKEPQLILILCDKEIRERRQTDGFACPEEYPRINGAGYYYKIFTLVEGAGKLRDAERFFTELQERYKNIEGVDYSLTGVTDERGHSLVRLEVQFERKMKGTSLETRLRHFGECLERVGIFRRVELCSVLPRKAQS